MKMVYSTTSKLKKKCYINVNKHKRAYTYQVLANPQIVNNYIFQI